MVQQFGTLVGEATLDALSWHWFSINIPIGLVALPTPSVYYKTGDKLHQSLT